jgi:hypothetical protein
VGFHRQALQPQFADRTAVDGSEVRINKMRLGKARQQASDRDGDGSAAEDVAEAVMRARTERENPLRFAMNIEARRVRKYVGIVVRGEWRRPYYHALEDARAADLGVARGNARKGEIAIAAETKAFLERVGNECRVMDQLLQLLRVRVEQVQRAADRTTGRRQRCAADAKNLIEQLAITKLVALIAGVDEIADEVGARARAPLVVNGPQFLHGAIESAPQFRRP